MKRILIVEDDEEFRRMLAQTLEKNGMDTLPADNTKEALAAVALKAIDAVFLDIMLGRENGWDTLRLLRSVSDAPIMLMSGAGVDDEMRLDAQKIGAQGVLQKPFDADQLLACLSGLLKDK